MGPLTVELTSELIARPSDTLVGLAPLVVGVLLVLGFMVARVLYIRRKAQEPPLPERPQPRAGAWETIEEEEQGHPSSPDHGPGHQDGPEPREYENASREPEEVKPGPRRYPEEFRGYPGPRT